MRSTSFNLGLLQAINYYKFFPKVDYLSTVSGGEYIGSSLSWFMSQLGKDFPFLTPVKTRLRRVYYAGYGAIPPTLCRAKDWAQPHLRQRRYAAS